MNNPFGLDDPSLAILSDPPTLPGNASLREALNLVRGSLDCQIPAAADGHPSSAPKAPVLGENTGCVLVVEEGLLQGIVTTRDLVRLASGSLDLENTRLAAVMTSPVLSQRQEELTNIFATIHLLRRHRIRHLPIVDEAGAPQGLVTISSLRRLLKQTFFLRFRQVAEVMTTKVITIEPQAMVQEAVKKLGDHAISCVVVVGLGNVVGHPGDGNSGRADHLKPVGILTESDVLQLQALGQDLSRLRVDQVMSGPPICVKPDDELGAVQDLMNRKWVGHLVVTNAKGHLAGVVTETHLPDVLDPLDLYGINEILQKQVNSLRDDRDRLLAGRHFDLKKGFSRGEFRLVYQPMLHLPIGRVHSAEALLRWSSQEHGNVSPDEFIPLAEQSGFIFELGDWILERACQQVLTFQNSPYGPISVAVNVSGLQLNQPDFVSRTCRTLDRLGVDPSLIHLELTESVLVENFSTTSETFRQLQQHGIRIAIDDFGTGYASLSYLQHFSFDILKIDRSFISELHHQPRNQAIVDSIMRLSEHLDFDLVAEGVESHFELDLLEGMGRPIYIQGYYVSPPLEAEAWPAFLAGRAASAEATTSQRSLPSPQEL